MRRAAGFGFISTLITALTLHAGCASESDILRSDPGLRASDLHDGKIAVLGVVKYQEPDQIRPPLIAMLQRTLAEERRDIPLVPADSVRDALGAERYRKTLLEYEYQGSLDEAALRDLAGSLRGVRFLVMARVDKDRTRYSTRGRADADTGSMRPDFAMGVTGRDARVTVHLYDLVRGTLVFAARYMGSSEESRPVRVPASGSPAGSGVRVDVGAATSPENEGYPGAPELALALEGPFRAFARALPGAPLRPGGAP